MQVKNFLLIFLLSLCSAGLKKRTAINQGLVKQATDSRTALLEYTGSLTNPFSNITIGAQISMDTSIGFRYDVTFQKGSIVLSHVAFFYKFSSPHQTVYYNYLSHKSEVINESPSEPNNNTNVIGTEKIDRFACTHLQHIAEHGSEDYWMSKAVPGFSQLSQILKNLDPGLMSSITETIFNWGGLVRLRMVSASSQGKTIMVLNLIEAQTGLDFPSSVFEVPSK